MSTLRRLQDSSDATKKHVAVLSAGVITALIAVLWSGTLSARFETIAQADQSKNPYADATLSELVDATRTQLGSVGSAFKKEEDTSVTIVEEEDAPKKPAVVGVRTIRIATTTTAVKTTE